MDTVISTPPPFKMTILHLFVLRDRGVVVWGEIHSGSIRVGDNVAVIGNSKSVVGTVTGIEFVNMPIAQLMEYLKDNKCGILIKGVNVEDMAIGMTVTSVET